jgi:hypothetical protein
MKPITKVIISAKHDIYSELTEITRIAEAVKIRASEALLPLFESGSEDMRTIAREVYDRFVNGYEKDIYDAEHLGRGEPILCCSAPPQETL